MLKRETDVPKITIPPEAELLLCCARKSIDPECAERIRSIVLRGIDWVYLFRLAISNGLISFLYSGLNSACPDIVPQGTLGQLRNQFEINLKRSRYLTKELTALLNLFDRHGILAVPFKGPTLAVSVYGNLSLRQFSDLDIMVRKQDVLAARASLISQGYKHKLLADGGEKTTRLAPENVYQLIRDDGKVIVEIHWGLAPDYFSFPFELESYMESLQYISLEGSQALTFKPEDLLLILCMHGGKHRWERLDWICDVSELVRSHSEMDWAEVIKQARAMGVERMLYLGLALTNRFFQTALPQEVLERIGRLPVITRLVEEVNRRFYCEDIGPPGLFETPFTIEGIKMADAYFHLRARERLRDKSRYCLHLFYLALKPNGRDQAIVSLPAAFSLLYYPLRPVRLINRYWLRAIKRVLAQMRGY